jgi:hypothetical protein
VSAYNPSAKDEEAVGIPVFFLDLPLSSIAKAEWTLQLPKRIEPEPLNSPSTTTTEHEPF